MFIQQLVLSTTSIGQTENRIFMNLTIEKTNKSKLFTKSFNGPASKTLKQFVNYLNGRAERLELTTMVLETVAYQLELHPYGAGEGIEPSPTSLEGWGFTTKLHPALNKYTFLIIM